MSQAIQLINPIRDSRDTAKMIANGARWLTLFCCFSTGFGVFVWGTDIAHKYLPDTFPGASIIAPAVGLLFAAGAGWLTDVGFGKILQKVIFNLLASRHPNVVKWNNGQSDYFNSMQTGERVGLVLLLVALLALDTVSTYIIADPVSQQAGNIPIINVDSLRTTITTTQAAELSTLRSRSSEKAKAIAETRNRVEDSNPTLAKLKAQGNGWAATKIAKDQSRATKADAAALEKNEQAVTTTIEQNRQYLTDRIAEAEQKNAQNQERNARNQAVFGTMYLAFSIGVKCLTILLRILLVVTFLAYSYRFNPDLTGDGIINYEDLQAFGKTQTAHGNFQ